MRKHFSHLLLPQYGKKNRIRKKYDNSWLLCVGCTATCGFVTYFCYGGYKKMTADICVAIEIFYVIVKGLRYGQRDSLKN